MRPFDPRDRRGASQVVGVVLLVGVVVILGAVVATFALDLGQEVSNVGPQASLAFDYAEGDGDAADCGSSGADRLVIEHASGDTLDPARISVTGSSDGDANVDLDHGCTGIPTEMTAGDSVSIRVEDGDVIRVVWERKDSTAVLGKWDGPNA